jgi:hypothetical protein
VGQLTSFPDPLDATWPPDAVGGKEWATLSRASTTFSTDVEFSDTFRSLPPRPRITLGIHRLLFQTEQVEKGNIQALHDGQQPI